MSTPTPPEYGLAAFDCPHCSAHAAQPAAQLGRTAGQGWSMTNYAMTVCAACGGHMMWHLRRKLGAGSQTIVSGELLWPVGLAGPAAPADLPDSVRSVYDEARSVANLSPRAAAALLRLALEGILKELYPDAGKLNAMIGEAAKAGLPEQIVQAMDVLRFNGNQSAHVLDQQDTPDTVAALFRILLLVVERLISEPRQIAEMHAALPEGVRRQIEQRDAAEA